MCEYLLVISIVILTHVTSVEVAINPAEKDCIAFNFRDYLAKKACQCVVYQSYGLNQGTFYSPNYPAFYARGIDCILFTFIGDFDEIVELTFIEMDIKPKIMGVRCTDYLRLFLNLDGPEVNEHSKHDHELCGNITDLSQKTFYSKGRPLIMEFHSDETMANFTGFKGRYKFIDKKLFRTSGTKLDGYPCSYQFNSGINSTLGYFYSPLYPQNYPAKATCSYTFHGKREERVKIIFMNIQLQHTKDPGNCSNAKDFIYIYDGRDNSAPPITDYCGHLLNNKVIYSSGPNLRIEFYSDASIQGKGFGAKFEFIPKNAETNTPRSIEGTTIVTNCNRDIYHKEEDPSTSVGTIENPGYPGMYPIQSTCTYTFHGLEYDRVQIQFQLFNLTYVGGDCNKAYDCTEQDSIWIFVDQQRPDREKGNFCGCKLPPQYMSDSPWMKVRFTAFSTHQGKGFAGFRFNYTFRQDFGITSGRQVGKLCTFEFYSNESRNGTFISPNHPWRYPKNLTCNYIFIGQSNEKVEISLDPFDVNGLPPSCEDDANDQSDYVMYTNFRKAEDRGINKKCGELTPAETNHISDGGYFRILFRANNEFEGRGFKGYYEFINVEEPLTTKSAPLSASSSLSSKLFTYNYLRLFVFTLTLFVSMTS